MIAKPNKATIIKKIIICSLLYVVGLSVGFFLIFLPLRHNHSDLPQIASVVASEIATIGEMTTEISSENIGIFYCKKGSTDPVVLYESQTTDTCLEHVAQYVYQKRTSHSELHINAVLNPVYFAVIATEPVLIQGELMGYIYAARIIHYLPPVMGAFTAFYSMLYVIILLYLRLQRKTNARIRDIYDKYIANISHELKTPIASIQAITSTLCEGLADDEATQKRYYSIIDRESKRLEQSVLDIIALSKLQDHQVDVHKTHTSMAEILPAIKDRYESFCDCVGMDFSIEPSMWGLSNLYTNPDRIIQLMQIIVDNAIKFSAEGDTISISATWDDKKATICIADTGCGMDEETITHLFDRFYRGKNALGKEGSGLGLAIAKELTNSLNEKIRAESILGKGTKFFFTVSRRKKT